MASSCAGTKAGGRPWPRDPPHCGVSTAVRSTISSAALDVRDSRDREAEDECPNLRVNSSHSWQPTMPRMSFKLPSTMSSGPGISTVRGPDSPMLVNFTPRSRMNWRALEAFCGVSRWPQAHHETHLGLLHPQEGLLVVPPQAGLGHDFLGSEEGPRRLATYKKLRVSTAHSYYPPGSA